MYTYNYYVYTRICNNNSILFASNYNYLTNILVFNFFIRRMLNNHIASFN